MKILRYTENVLFCLLCISTIFACPDGVSRYFVSKCYLVVTIALLYFFILLIREIFDKYSMHDCSFMYRIIAAACFGQALYGLAQWCQLGFPLIGNYKVEGSFDNPAGFASCLSIGLPFVLFSVKDIGERKLMKRRCLLAMVILVAIVISGSRAGVISAIFTIALFYKMKLKNSIYVISVVLLSTLFLLGIYCFKKDSADGRLLIWRCSLEMIMDSPILGHGMNGFKAHYMDYQAKYFESHRGSSFEMLADEIHHPFNEYLMIAVNFGLIGLFLVIILIAVVLFCYFKNSCQESRVAFSSLTAVCVFSMFSYPCKYAFTWMVLVVGACVIISRASLLRMSHKTKPILCCCSLPLIAILLCQICQQVNIHKMWDRLNVFKASSREMYFEYAYLSSYLGENPYFLYDYAIELFDNNLLDESLSKALLCRNYWANFNLELLIGDIYRKQHKYELAEKYYISASNMCPCRFIPLYQLFELYKEQGDMLNARLIARSIMDKRVKVDSMIIMQMKFRVRQYAL